MYYSLLTAFCQLKIKRIYTVSRKKDQNVFHDISYETRAMLTKFGIPFPG